MKKLDIREVTGLINKLEEKFKGLDINSDEVRENVLNDFSEIKEVLRKNPSDERIIERLKLFLRELQDNSYGNKNLNSLIYDLEEFIKKADITSDF
ncbi:MAG TPA: hypothetical protein PKC91_12045 [Ignavibacteria bacterium]|nr:hypothetical protein [Ignavibacteria bacterium]